MSQGAGSAQANALLARAVASGFCVNAQDRLGGETTHDPHRHHRRRFQDHRRHDAAGLSRLRGGASAKDDVSIWLALDVVNKLRTLRGPGESYSDVILRLATDGESR